MKKYILFFLTILVFSGCGAGHGPAPFGSTAIFNPSSISVTGNAVDPVGFAPAIITATVKDANGKELYNARLHFIFSFSTSPSETVLSDNGLTLMDLVTLNDGTTLVNEYLQDTNTSGNAVLNMRILAGGGLAYSGNLLVYDSAGKLLATAVITVTSS
jgi:hypothetical protein